MLATAGSDRTVRLWDGRTGKARQVLSSHADTVRTLAFRDDGRILAAAGNDGVTRLWDPVAGTECGSFPDLQRVGSIG